MGCLGCQPAQAADLRVADIAMGTGAFFVAACRYLADRIREARALEGTERSLREKWRATTGFADAEVPPLCSTLDARSRTGAFTAYPKLVYL